MSLEDIDREHVSLKEYRAKNRQKSNRRQKSGFSPPPLDSVKEAQKANTKRSNHVIWRSKINVDKLTPLEFIGAVLIALGISIFWLLGTQQGLSAICLFAGIAVLLTDRAFR